MSQLSGFDLLRFWEASDLSQRGLARSLDMNFNVLHGKIYRAQQELKKERSVAKTQEYPRVMFSACVFDIETTEFHAGGVQDHMICTSVLPLSEEVPVTYKIEYKDRRNDKRLLKETVEALSQFDILIGHNITAFDLNWLNTRMAYHGLPTPNKLWAIYDTYQAARRMALKADRKSLAFLADFFRLPNLKTAILPVAHSMIDSPDEEEFNEALEGIVFHCENDVILNRMLFDALWPRDRSLNNLPIYKRLN